MSAMNTNSPMTVRDLFNACVKEIGMGNADKEIFISSDDEGNEFHPLYYLFTTNVSGDITSYNNMGCMRDCRDVNNAILLG